MNIPAWAGAVRQQELRTQLAVVPLNLILAAWHEAWWWLRFRMAGRLNRWRMNRRAIKNAVERGRRAGFNQGKADAAMKLGRFADEYLARTFPK